MLFGLDPVLIQLGGFLVQLIVLISTLVVGLVRHSRSLREMVAETRLMIETTRLDIEKKISEELSKMRESQVIGYHDVQASFGDSLSAIRQKITDVEIWSRDTFVREKDFRPIIESMTRSIDALGEKVDGRIDRLELKFDKIILKSQI